VPDKKPASPVTAKHATRQKDRGKRRTVSAPPGSRQGVLRRPVARPAARRPAKSSATSSRVTPASRPRRPAAPTAGVRHEGRASPASKQGPPEPAVTRPTAGVRLQKILADAGIASRRAAEQLILDGAISVNGRVVRELGVKADAAHNDIRINGVPIGQPSPPVYFALHKPAGYITTSSDEYGRATVLDLMQDAQMRIFPIGRLDRESEGLLLFTNNGDLAVRLTHPRYGIEKEYHVLIEPLPNETAIQRLRDGVVIEGQRTAPADVEKLNREGNGAWLSVTIHEGRNRQIRLMCEAVGFKVVRLVRVRIGPVQLNTLEPGKHRLLSSREVGRLLTSVGLAEPPVLRPVRTGQRKRKAPAARLLEATASPPRRAVEDHPRRPRGPQPIEGNYRRNRTNRPQI
jgi:23S rRNA pseudouridine2605 synthase